MLVTGVDGWRDGREGLKDGDDDLQFFVHVAGWLDTPEPFLRLRAFLQV